MSLPVACVLYAAKSTADRRESIPDQLRECREAVGDPSTRVILAEYTDEAFGAFRSNRGPALVEAMQHAEELAEIHGASELWAQHSDRLARGDGRSARHAVEIALWALKHDVRVRTVQDPDTFRDLLYAVVTGQRNNEDSRRKGRSSKAGRRRAAARGDFIGWKPDGYRIAVDIDKNGGVKKRMEIDPERRPAIELIFRLALRGKSSGVIARALNDAGWLTRPRVRQGTPKLWTTNRVIEVLKNKRYAGIAVFNGEIVARGHWPAYITERQLARIDARLAQRRPSKYPRELESYLLARVGRCGRCASALLALTSNPHGDGTLIRRYVCASHFHGRHAGRCSAKPIDAGMVEAMFVASIGLLLAGEPDLSSKGAMHPPEGSRLSDTAAGREQLRSAMLAGDDAGAESALNALFAKMHPEAALIRDSATSRRLARELGEAQTLRDWIVEETAGRTPASREMARELNGLLRSWFSTISLTISETNVEIVGKRPGAGDLPGVSTAVNIDRCTWTRFAPLERRPHRRYRTWVDAEIVGALQAWTDVHGHDPSPTDWRQSAAYHPIAPTPREVSAGPARVLTGDDIDLIRALSEYTAEHGSPPSWADWLCAPPQHPCAQTVHAHFGSWRQALDAAGRRANL